MSVSLTVAGADIPGTVSGCPSCVLSVSGCAPAGAELAVRSASVWLQSPSEVRDT